MRDLITTWLDSEVESYRADSEGFATRMARSLTVRAVLVAEACNLVLHVILDLLGLLPYPLLQAIVIGGLMTTVIAGVITFTITFHVAEAIATLSISRDAFERLSTTDMLSGLKNRRAFFEKLEGEADEAIVIIFDIDRFKQINDTYGHIAGDRVIQGVARLLSDAFEGAQATVGRLGGEEFGVLLRKQAGDGHLALVDRARAAISEARIDFERSSLQVTVSAGVAEFSDGRETLDCYARADQALYCAKAAGRNRVVHERSVAAILGDRPEAAVKRPDVPADRRSLRA